MKRQFKRGSAFERALQLAREKQRRADGEARKASAIEAAAAAGTAQTGPAEGESATGEAGTP